VTAQDIKDLKAAGGKVSGSDMVSFSDEGGKLTQDDLTELQKMGVDFSPKEMGQIQTKQHLPLSLYAPGTTVADLMVMLKNGAKITGEDLIALKGPDGKTPLATMQDFCTLSAKGVHITDNDLIAFQKAGGKITADDLVKFLDNKGTLHGDSLVALAQGAKAQGTTLFTAEQLTKVVEAGKCRLTPKNFVDINPISAKTGKPYYANPGVDQVTPSDMLDMLSMGIKVNSKDFIAPKGANGKPLVTEQNLLDFMAAKGRITGPQLTALRDAGMELSPKGLVNLVYGGVNVSTADVIALTHSADPAHPGVVLTDAQLLDICKESKVPLTPADFAKINPISSRTGAPRFGDPVVFKASDLVEMLRLDVDVTGHDLLACNPPPTAKEVTAFAQANGKLTGMDLVALQKAGVKFSGDDLVELAQCATVDISAQDVVDLAQNGMVIYQDDLDAVIEQIKKKGGSPLTSDQWRLVNPLRVKTGLHMYDKNGNEIDP
jgi:hypothetical protein